MQQYRWRLVADEMNLAQYLTGEIWSVLNPPPPQ